MLFALLKISGAKLVNGGFAYKSVIMKQGASAKFVNEFGTEDELIVVVNRILARQKRHTDARRVADVRRVLDQVRDGGYYFFDLDLTAEEAESLGWQVPRSLEQQSK
jgi:hypothetical protein